MPRFCCVPKCFNSNDNKKLFHIPRPEVIQKIWIERIGRNEIKQSSQPQLYLVCEDHFHEDCLGPSKKLMKFSLPTLNLSEYSADPSKKDIFFHKTVGETCCATSSKKEVSSSTTASTSVDINEDLRVLVSTRRYDKKKGKNILSETERAVSQSILEESQPSIQEPSEEVHWEDIPEGEVCKETWRKLRDNYGKAKQLRKTKSGQSAKNIQQLRFEKELAFLNPHFQQPLELQTSNLSVPSSGDEDDADNAIQPKTECFSEPTTPDSVKSVSSVSKSRLSGSLKRKRMHVQQSPMQEYLQFKREHQILQQTEKHPLDVFFSSMAATVKTFPVALQLKIKQQIFHLITETEATLINPETMGNSIAGPSQHAVQPEASAPLQNISHNISGAGPSRYPDKL